MRIKNLIAMAIVLFIAMFIISGYFQLGLQDKTPSFMETNKLVFLSNNAILNNICSDTSLNMTEINHILHQLDIIKFYKIFQDSFCNPLYPLALLTRFQLSFPAHHLAKYIQSIWISHPFNNNTSYPKSITGVLSKNVRKQQLII
jgi:hypothetical protein